MTFSIIKTIYTEEDNRGNCSRFYLRYFTKKGGYVWAGVALRKKYKHYKAAAKRVELLRANNKDSAHVFYDVLDY